MFRKEIAALGLLAFCMSANAYPDRPITVVVGYPAGGPADVSLRIISDTLAKKLGQPIVVENKAGANATIATLEVSRASPDGYKLLLAAGNHVTNSFVYKDLKYDPITSFKAVALISQTPTVLAVRADNPARNIKELIEQIKKKDGRYNYSSTGYGSTSHIAGEMFKQHTGTRIQHIPYKGVGQAVTELLGGSIDVILPSLGSVMPFFDNGKLKPLGVAAKQRIPELKDTPTFGEQGLQGMELETWYGLLAPAGTPDAVIAKINEAVNSITRDGNIRNRLLTLGMYAENESVQEFSDRIKKDHERMEKLTQTVDLTKDNP